MKPLIMSVAAGAVLMTGAAAAQAQSIEAPIPSVVETEGLPRLPDYFRDCWAPLPAHCARPPGLLWFGNPATLEHEHGARLHDRRALRRHREHTGS